MLLVDVLVTYSDWITETKSVWWEFYWIDWLEKQVEKIFRLEDNIQKAYDAIINDIKIFKWWASFEDDSTLLIIKRNAKKDIKSEDNTFIKELSIKEWLNRKEKKQLAWKTKDEINVELQRIRKGRKSINRWIAHFPTQFLGFSDKQRRTYGHSEAVRSGLDRLASFDPDSSSERLKKLLPKQISTDSIPQHCYPPYEDLRLISQEKVRTSIKKGTG